MFRRFGILAVLASIALAGVGVSPAEAGPWDPTPDDGSGAATATVTGAVTTTETPCSFLDPDGDLPLYDGSGYAATFDELAMLGLFVDDQTQSAIGVVEADEGPIVACVDGGMTVDDDIPLVAQGAIAEGVTDTDTSNATADPGDRGEFADGSPNTGSLDGEIITGKFVTLGAVAAVVFKVVYDVNAPLGSPDADTNGSCAGVIGVAPLGLADENQDDQIAGQIACR